MKRKMLNPMNAAKTIDKFLSKHGIKTVKDDTRMAKESAVEQLRKLNDELSDELGFDVFDTDAVKDIVETMRRILMNYEEIRVQRTHRTTRR